MRQVCIAERNEVPLRSPASKCMSCLLMPYNPQRCHEVVPKHCSLPTSTNMNASTSAVTTEVCSSSYELIVDVVV